MQPRNTVDWHPQTPVLLQQARDPAAHGGHSEALQKPASLVPPELVEPPELVDPPLLLLLEMQLPRLQTMFVPHPVPSGTIVALPHVGTPVVHVVVPV